MKARGLLIDLDDTLFDHEPAEHHARAHTFALVAADTGITADEAEAHYFAARDAVKARLGKRGAAHSRLLYLHEIAHRIHAASGKSVLAKVAGWNDAFWTAYLEKAVLRSGARELLAAARKAGMKIAIVTDLVMDTQLRKLARFELFDAVDALVVSEEVPLDKPAPEGFVLAADRIGIPLADCVMVGDSRSKDGAGAAALGIPFYRAESSSKSEASGEPAPMSLYEIAKAMGVSND